ncbi:hypothetical protein J7M00_04415 [bacterium]|nr:hypothetical protein [bacterium]
MFIIIILILVVDSVMLGIFAVQCNRSAAEYLIPMYLLQLIGYAALYRIYLKTKGGKREKLEDKLKRLREENIALKKSIGEDAEKTKNE